MKLSIVIPAYNEEENISKLMEDLITLRTDRGWDCELVIVNDNSTDATGRIAEDYSNRYTGITVVHRESGNNGMGFSLIDGTGKAAGEAIIWMMGDCSDDLSTVPKIVEKLESCDMVIGSRYMSGGSRGDLGLEKALLGKNYTFITRMVFGIPVNDITNAFRGFRREVFEKVKPESGDFAISPEFAIKAHRGGFKLGEVPTTYINRKAGQPKFKIFKMGVRYVSLFKYRLRRV